MCCIFTCIAWFVDFVQRTWTFLMSFCVMVALCCLMFVASCSGIVMGYNYSITEFIETKETNISVHLKRGIFDLDPSVVADFQSRRSGDEPDNGNKIPPDTVQPVISGGQVLKQQELPSVLSRKSDRPSIRRMEDSIFETDDRHQFEGSLLKLTAKPGEYGTVNLATSTTHIIGNEEINQAIDQLKPGSLDQLKGVQNIINRRRMNALTRSTPKTPTSTYLPVEMFMNSGVIGQGKSIIPVDGGRRMMDHSDSPFIDAAKITLPNMQMWTKGESLRDYVPEQGVGDPSKWFLPKVAPELQSAVVSSESDDLLLNGPITHPPPVTPRRGPLTPARHRPQTKPPTTMTTMESPSTVKVKAEDDIFVKPYGSDFDDTLVEGMGQSAEDIKKFGKEYYDEDIKGLPVRKRRNVYPYRKLLPYNNFKASFKNPKIEYRMETKINIKPIVTIKGKVITKNEHISNTLTFIEDYKKTNELYNKNTMFVRFSTSGTISPVSIVKTKTTASTTLLPTLVITNDLPVPFLGVNTELGTFDQHKSTSSKLDATNELLSKIIKSTLHRR